MMELNDTKYKEEFSLRLARLRTDSEVSARDMSLSIGQNPGYINNIESGKALPSMTAFFYICEYLHLTPAEFFESDKKCPEKIRLITEKLSCLSIEELNCIDFLVSKLVDNNK